MRTKLVGLFLAGGLMAATLTSALACQYNMTSADNDKSSPPQTAQADPPATPDKN